MNKEEIKTALGRYLSLNLFIRQFNGKRRLCKKVKNTALEAL